MKNNCMCLCANRRKRPTETRCVCSARMSRRQREQAGKTAARVAVVKRQERAKGTTPKPAKVTGKSEALSHSDI
jgi:hypothetical protein